MLWYIIKGGPVMIPIILASILGLAIILEKLWHLIRHRADDEEFKDEVFRLAKMKKYDAAIDLCIRHAMNPVACVLRAGLEKRELTIHDIERACEREGNSQVKSLEKYIGGLISIIGIEPLLGFLGTITGLIKAFMAWEKVGPNITVSMLAGGIYEAMITTAAGLIVAVPYYLICNFIISKIKYVTYELTDSSTELVEILSEAKSAKR